MDYKDNAIDAYYTLQGQAMRALQTPALGYTQRRAISNALRRMPDGHSCPREFRDWDPRPLQAAIAAAKGGAK